MTTTLSKFVKEAGYVYGNLGHGVIELGRFQNTSQKVSLMNTFRQSDFLVTCVGNDLIVTMRRGRGNDEH